MKSYNTTVVVALHSCMVWSRTLPNSIYICHDMVMQSQLFRCCVWVACLLRELGDLVLDLQDVVRRVHMQEDGSLLSLYTDVHHA